MGKRSSTMYVDQTQRFSVLITLTLYDHKIYLMHIVSKAHNSRTTRATTTGIIPHITRTLVIQNSPFRTIFPPLSEMTLHIDHFTGYVCMNANEHKLCTHSQSKLV